MSQEPRILGVGFMSRAPQVWWPLAALALLLGSGCHLHGSARTTPSAASNERASSPSLPPGTAAEPQLSDDPPPPASHPDTHSALETRLTHSSGASICAQQRPELAAVLLAVDVTNYTAPEQRVLLRAWLAATLAPSPSESELHLRAYAAPGCGDHLFCMAFSEDRAEQAVDQLADFFNQASVQTFPAARVGALEQVEELYQRSSTFRLHALVEALFTGRISALNAAQLQPVEAAVGAGALLTVLPAAAHQALLAELPATQVSIFAPHAAQALGQRLLDRLRVKVNSAPRLIAPYVPTAPIRISDERYPHAQLLLTWPTLAPDNVRPAVSALAHLAEQVKARHPSVLATVHEGGAITPRPALRVAASWATLLQLAPTVDAWATQHTSSLGSLPPTSPPAAPCTPGPAANTAGSGPAWGRPQVIMWGAEHSQPTTEEFL